VHRNALTAVATLALLGISQAARADVCPDGDGKAKCLVQQAQQQQDPREAAKLYLASYRLDPKIDALAGYGSSLEADKDFVGASEALEKAVEGYDQILVKMQGDNADAAQVNALQHRIEFVRDELKTMGLKVAKVQLKVTGDKLPANVASVLRKNGDDLRPSNPTKLIVHPGGDVLLFSFTDGKSAEKFVNLSPGTLSTVDIPDEPKPAPVVNIQPIEKRDTGDDQRQLAYFIGGAGVLFLGAGVGYGLATSSPSTPVVATLVGVGGAGLGASLVFYLWGNAKRTAATKPQAMLVPVVNDHMVGLSFSSSL
jgi:hypothetical protein